MTIETSLMQSAYTLCRNSKDRLNISNEPLGEPKFLPTCYMDEDCKVYGSKKKKTALLIALFRRIHEIAKSNR